ncbi:CRISPR-associated endonuclease Cas1 [Oceanotoga sp. DSM 15011]|uniref:CRISPR-associated endonuclease Cas1 n=1 Tax=Oceanotoga sp. DSM 15011 TaxID=2984951 RepID=UPI0021F40164|nr:CRISPR-associated endonuclease Cas1 [Oceanotoga sp. DSM 15011]UYP00552.1 CRISPR-associated endonuclease Cas1 [Oceanotoga sp. DSM 15011]
MKTKYLMSMGTLSRKDNSLDFKNEKGHNYIPITEIREIYLMNEISLNTKLLSFLSQNNIIVHYFDYYGFYRGTFFPKEHYISGKLLLKQINAYENKRILIAKKIVLAISINIYNTLYHYYRHGNNEIYDYLNYLKDDCKNKIEKSKTINNLLAVEGEIWQLFYKNIKYIINQIYHTHLNQSISYLHELSKSRFSLSLDLSEAFKPIIVFKTIFDLINNKKINLKEHFNKKVNYCVLNEKGKEIFLINFEKRLDNKFDHKSLKRKISYNSAIKYDGYKLIKFLLEEKDFMFFNDKEKK